jgi:nitrate/TMAO reductase-like tetraheme cytochrome c subunit
MNRTLTMAAILGALALAGASLAQEPAPAAQTQASPYLGADSCRECHGAYYTAWSDTKHATTLNHLSAADREGGQCIRCHATGSPEMFATEGAKPSLPGVQCEACHGPGRPHVEAAKAGATKPRLVTKAPAEKICIQCHNSGSPHYRPFFYAAMTGLVHRVKK